MTTTQFTPDAGTPMENSETSSTPSRARLRHLSTVARILLGLLFLMTGLMGILNLMPPSPPTMPAAAIAFNEGMAKTGYMMPLIFGTQFVVALLLLSNRFVPLALALLAPFLVNSFAFHAFLVPEGLGMITFVTLLELYLAWAYRNTFSPMLAMRVTPTTP